ncbi:AMP-binding protein, partial [Candidatus Poribacteria bacterium]
MSLIDPAISSVSHDLSVQKLIEAQADRNPDAVAILAPDRAPLTYSQLLTHVEDTIGTLGAMGIGRNDRVAIVLPNGPEMATAFLAVASGATSAPLNPDYRPSEYDFYLSDLNARALIVQSGMDSHAVAVAKVRGIPVIELSPVLQEAAGIFAITGDRGLGRSYDSSTHPEDVALALHTSGTTSRPKLVLLTHTNICRSAYNHVIALGLNQHDRCLNVMPLFHIHGLITAVLSSLVAGGSVLCTPGFYASKFFGWMGDFHPSWYTSAPTIHQAILEHSKANTDLLERSPLRFIRSAASPLPPQVMSELEEAFGVPVIESYGMTESAAQITSNPMPPGRRKPGSVGIAAGPEIAIMDEAGRLIDSGDIGEIVIRGASVIREYGNNLEANEESFSNGWFRTGDQGYLDSESYLFITGRIKEIINRGGEKISPREVDEVLMTHPAVTQAVAFAVPHKQLGEEIAAAVVLREGSSATEEQIQEFAFERLASFKIPRQVLILNEIPKGPTGKIQRIGLAERLRLAAPESSERLHDPDSLREPDAHQQQLIQKHRAQTDLQLPFVPPRTSIERKLAEIWADVLGIKKVGIYDDFLELGGNSISALNFFSRLREISQVEIPVRTLFHTTNIADMAAAIAKHQDQQKDHEDSVALDTSIKPNPENKYQPFPLTDIQEAYWIGRSGAFELGNVSSHRYVELENIDLDVERLSDAWQRLIERHEMLRAVVLPDGQQKILEHVPSYHVRCLDLRGQEPHMVESQLQAIRQRMSHQVMELDRWPLFEIRASILDDQRVRLHMSFDFLNIDAWSFWILIQELSQLY